MSTAAATLKAPTPTKAFEVGTTGWTAADLDDPFVAAEWADGRYEIIEGVLTQMAAALARGGGPTGQMIILLGHHLHEAGLGGEVMPELDLLLSPRRVLLPDIAVMLPEDIRAQQGAVPPGTDWRDHRITVPPTLVVETLSRGHESHDRETKAVWYAEFGVPFFWLMDPADRSLEGLALRDGEYHTAGRAEGDAEIALPPFDGLTIPLKKVFGTP